MEEKTGFNKQAIHADGVKKDPYGALSVPVYNAAAFEFDSAEAMELAFTGKTNDFVYARISNPTVQAFEKRLAIMDGAERAVATSSGMAAVHAICMAYLKAGDHVICSRAVFGSIIALFEK